jgi:hypothetical protein
VPAPPPRVVEATEVEAPPPLGTIPEPPRTLPPAAERPTTPPRAETAKPEPARAADVPAAAESPKPPEEPRAPAATLQTMPPQQEGALEGKIRGVLLKASSNLNRVDYSRLNANGKSQYDSAKRFISLAEDALRMKNLVYAGSLADKAADLAAQLPGR